MKRPTCFTLEIYGETSGSNLNVFTKWRDQMVCKNSVFPDIYGENTVYSKPDEMKY